MITVDDIAAAVTSRANATANYSTVLPGSLWFDRGPDTPAGVPYGVFTVRPNPPEWFSGNAYLQTFTVSVMGYAPMGGNITPSNVEQFVNAALSWQQSNMTLRGDSSGELVLAVKPTDGEGKFDYRLRQGKDVFTSGQTFDVICQGNRGAS